MHRDGKVRISESANISRGGTTCRNVQRRTKSKVKALRAVSTFGRDDRRFAPLSKPADSKKNDRGGAARGRTIRPQAVTPRSALTIHI